MIKEVISNKYKVLRLIILVFILNSCVINLSSAQEINPNGYNKFYYETTGIVSSEGNLCDGKPCGYWKSYYRNKNIKSEGNRKDFKLDSLWKFYNEDGKLTTEYYYVAGKRDGLKKNYSVETGKLSSDEMFVNDVKEGETRYYYDNGVISSRINFKAGKEEGVSYEYSKDGTIITIIYYRGGFIGKQEKINRRDNKGLKQDMWKTFYENGNVKNEARYLDDKLNGYYKEFDQTGSLMKVEKYINGIKQEKADELIKLDVETDYYDNGKPKSVATYKNGKKEGVERFFGDTGQITNSKIYKEGILVGEGIYDERGLQQGKWKEYHPTGVLKAEGEYKDGKRIGNWIFYHADGELEQKGKFTKSGKPDGEWNWYYDSKQLMRKENFIKGVQEGEFTEYHEDGTLMTKGQYYEGKEDGHWMYDNGDYKEEGDYKTGEKTGVWKGFYNDGKLAFEGGFVDGNPDGKHVYYYDTGKIKNEGKYVMGNKEGNWKSFDPEGNLILDAVYSNDVEIKLDGTKINLEEK